MLGDRPAFSSFSAPDIAAEKDFYAGTLGLEVRDRDGILTVRAAGGQRLMIYPKENHQPATFTVLNFAVDDIDAAVDVLTSAGVTMERYGPDFNQDERGIARDMGPPIAWFTDPAGNILSVMQLTGEELEQG